MGLKSSVQLRFTLYLDGSTWSVDMFATHDSSCDWKPKPKHPKEFVRFLVETSPQHSHENDSNNRRYSLSILNDVAGRRRPNFAFPSSRHAACSFSGCALTAAHFPPSRQLVFFVLLATFVGATWCGQQVYAKFDSNKVQYWWCWHVNTNSKLPPLGCMIYSVALENAHTPCVHTLEKGHVRKGGESCTHLSSFWAVPATPEQAHVLTLGTTLMASSFPQLSS